MEFADGAQYDPPPSAFDDPDVLKAFNKKFRKGLHKNKVDAEAILPINKCPDVVKVYPQNLHCERAMQGVPRERFQTAPPQHSSSGISGTSLVNQCVIHSCNARLHSQCTEIKHTAQVAIAQAMTLRSPAMPRPNQQRRRTLAAKRPKTSRLSF
ncbi:hypothetical protein SARC_03672 [Sphaeroforma arctica JP610]|uniref:Uncharacterized protein n=1 Tax=Sphaeroforma arctica JP610 TaxID=667725 RepID=A0A0L0G501_9EUKA|nr:hypothetical protein SARC_03672 [Sphaeroforma arctica JP610]KNC84107.1 hypothetical protein SARC_03672 [Sphaeroforma arctica JP610]|eukprot:XP_014158009.1 hypothetical protein SARC_03672 [Sphaeroforma arctica JP610]